MGVSGATMGIDPADSAAELKERAACEAALKSYPAGRMLSGSQSVDLRCIGTPTFRSYSYAGF